MDTSEPIDTKHDATIPDPEELDERDVGELRDIPLPERVRRDIHAGADANEAAELDDDIPSHPREDLTHGDEGIDDPSTLQRPRPSR